MMKMYDVGMTTQVEEADTDVGKVVVTDCFSDIFYQFGGINYQFGKMFRNFPKV